MENSPPPPNVAAKEESPSPPPPSPPPPSPPPPSKKPRLEDEEEEEGWFFGMKIDSDVDPDSWEPHVDVYDSEEDEEDSDKEKWNQYFEKLKGGGYDLDCFGPSSLMAVYGLYWSKYDQDPDDPYDEVNDMAEFVIRDLNADESLDKTYKLVEVERVVWTTSFYYLLTFAAKELPAGAGAGAGAGAAADDPVIITFQATVHGHPNRPYSLVERRVKPVANIAKDDDN